MSEQQEPYGWWSSFKKLNELETQLEKLVTNPTKERLIDIDREYSTTELRELLQKFGSYLSTLYPIAARIKAENHALKETFNTGMKVSMASLEAPTKGKTTVKDREAEILSQNETFRDTKRYEIDGEAMETLVQGWIKSYETAQFTISRLITLSMGEAQFTTSNRFT